MKPINLQTEPVAIIAAITTLVEAIIATLPLFGVPLTVEQQAALMAVVIAVGGVVSAVLARPLVTPWTPANPLVKYDASPPIAVDMEPTGE